MKALFLFVALMGILFSDGIKVYYNLPAKTLINTSDSPIARALLSEIGKAEKSIDFAIYGLRNQPAILEALIKAKNRGIRIRGVVDKDTKNQNYYSSTDLLYKHFDIEDDYGHAASYIMHNKFFIFDEERVFTGSTNISDSGMGGYNANIAALVDSKKVAQAYKDELEQMLEGLFHRNKKKLSAEDLIDVGGSRIKVFFLPNGQKIEDSIIPMIENAKNEINVAIFYLTHRLLAQSLIKAHQRGVNVKIILDASAAKNRYVLLAMLRKNGIATKVEAWGGKMHMKSLSVDGKYLLLGSMNFTIAGETKNDENVLIIDNEKLTQEYDRHFGLMWKSIDSKWLNATPQAEGIDSPGSCTDGIDNDFDSAIDINDKGCYAEL